MYLFILTGYPIQHQLVSHDAYDNGGGVPTVVTVMVVMMITMMMVMMVVVKNMIMGC